MTAPIGSRTPEAPSAVERIVSLLHPAVSFLLGFVRERTRESCTRLCALLCCATGCTIGIATIGIAEANPSEAASIVALGGLASAFIAGGTVALLVRTRKDALGSHAEQSEVSAVPALAGGAQ